MLYHFIRIVVHQDLAVELSASHSGEVARSPAGEKLGPAIQSPRSYELMFNSTFRNQ